MSQKNLPVIAEEQKNITRRCFLKGGLVFVPGLILMPTTLASVNILRSPYHAASRNGTVFIEPINYQMITLPSGKNIFVKMFNFKNSFWRGVGGIFRRLINRAVGFDLFDMTPKYPQIEPYANMQSQGGYQPAPGGSVFEIPNQTLSFPMQNTTDTGFMDTIANNYGGNRNVFGVQSPTVIMLAEFLRALQCTCGHLDQNDLRGLLTPVKLHGQSPLMPISNRDYKGVFETERGWVKIVQKPNVSYRRPNGADLSIEVADNGGPTQFRKYVSATPFPINYDDIDADKGAVQYNNS